jgi:hypothetical protein
MKHEGTQYYSSVFTFLYYIIFPVQNLGQLGSVCVNKFSVKPSSPYSYSKMGSKIFHCCFEVDGIGDCRRQARPGRPEGKFLLYPYLSAPPPPGGQTRSSLAGGSQPIALPLRSKAAATDQNAGWSRPRAPPQERQHPALSLNRKFQICPPRRM